VIIFEHVTKRYPGGTVAVDDLGLEVPDGKIMILVGPSGYGKTTTLRMVNRLVEPTGVTILLDGHDVAQARLALRRGIGYVIQQTGHRCMRSPQSPPGWLRTAGDRRCTESRFPVRGELAGRELLARFPAAGRRRRFSWTRRAATWRNRAHQAAEADYERPRVAL
jgi:ABC-type transport system involved in cytochrome c biogenesis ATPase subunit